MRNASLILALPDGRCCRAHKVTVQVLGWGFGVFGAILRLCDRAQLSPIFRVLRNVLCNAFEFSTLSPDGAIVVARLPDGSARASGCRMDAFRRSGFECADDRAQRPAFGAIR